MGRLSRKAAEDFQAQQAQIHQQRAQMAQQNNPLAGLAQIIAMQNQGQQQPQQQQVQYQQPQPTLGSYMTGQINNATNQIGDALARNQAVIANRGMQEFSAGENYRNNLLSQLGAGEQARMNNSTSTENLQISEKARTDRMMALLNSLVPALAGSGGGQPPGLSTNYGAGVRYVAGQSDGYQPPSTQGTLDGTPSMTPQGASNSASQYASSRGGGYTPMPSNPANGYIPAGPVYGDQPTKPAGWAGLPRYSSGGAMGIPGPSFNGGTAQQVRQAANEEMAGLTPYRSGTNRKGPGGDYIKRKAAAGYNPAGRGITRQEVLAASPGYSPFADTLTRYT